MIYYHTLSTLRRSNRLVVPVHLIEIHKYGSKGTGYGQKNPTLDLLESILKKVRLVLLISNLRKEMELDAMQVDQKPTIKYIVF